MNSGQLTDYRRLQSVVCSAQQKQAWQSNYYVNDNDIIPNADDQYTLGNSQKRFHSLYLGPGTIYMGDASETQISVNECNVLVCKPGIAGPYFEFTNSSEPNDTESDNSGIHVYYNAACNDLWKRYPDGVNAPFGTFRGETGPQGPEWQFSNDLIPTQEGLNIGSVEYNVNNLYLSNTLFLNTIPVIASGGFLSVSDVPVATRNDITNGISSISSIVAYGLSTVAGGQGISSLSSIVSYGLSSVNGGRGISSLSSIVSYGLSTVNGGGGVSSLSSIVSYGLSSVSGGMGISSLSSIVSYGLSTVAGGEGISSLSSIVAYGLSTVAGGPGISSLSSIVSYGLSTVNGGQGISSLSSIVSYGLSTVNGGQGISSLSSIVAYGLSTVSGGHGVSSLSSLVVYGLSSIINSNTLQPLMGRVLRVDQLYGNDALAIANGNHYQIAFQTIGSAMAHAQAGECIYVLPGSYNEKIVFSNNVSLRGINTPSVKIQQINCTVPTTLVTLAQNNRIEDVTLNLTSSNSNATPLIGVFLSNIADPITATKMRGIVVNVDNSAMTCNVPTTVYGVYTTGNSSILPISSDDIERSTVNVTSSGPGAKRGIYNNGSNGFRGRNVNIFCKDNPAYPNTSNGTYFGIETNNVNAFIFIKSSTSYGYASVAGNNAADISQTLGTIALAGTDLPNRTANGKGFTNSTAQPSVAFGVGGSTNATNFTYLMPGSVADNKSILTYKGIRIPTISMIDQFAFQAVTLPGGTTYAYLFKNGVIQPSFTLSLASGGLLYTNTSNVSLTMTPQDNYAVMLSNSGGITSLQFPLVTVSFY